MRPRCKTEVGNRASSANEPWAVLGRRHLFLRQDLVQHSRHAVHLLDVAFDGTGELLVVKLFELGSLTVVRTLARGLEVEVLLGLVCLGAAGREADLML